MKLATAMLITVLLGTASANALPFGSMHGQHVSGQTLTSPATQRIVKRTYKLKQNRANRGSGKFAGSGGGTKDTCNSSHPFYGGDCSPEALTKRCDNAGGGMSSEPGGGVTCDTSHWD